MSAARSSVGSSGSASRSASCWAVTHSRSRSRSSCSRGTARRERHWVMLSPGARRRIEITTGAVLDGVGHAADDGHGERRAQLALAGAGVPPHVGPPRGVTGVEDAAQVLGAFGTLVFLAPYRVGLVEDQRRRVLGADRPGERRRADVGGRQRVGTSSRATSWARVLPHRLIGDLSIRRRGVLPRCLGMGRRGVERHGVGGFGQQLPVPPWHRLQGAVATARSSAVLAPAHTACKPVHMGMISSAMTSLSLPIAEVNPPLTVPDGIRASHRGTRCRPNAQAAQARSSRSRET